MSSEPEYEDVDSEVVVETEQPAIPDADELMKEHYHEIRRQAVVCAELAAKARKAKSKYTAAKEDWECANETLAELINTDPLQRKLQFEDDLPSTGWESRSIEDMADYDIPAKKIEVLLENDIRTLGDLQKLMQKLGHAWANDLKGFGEAMRTRVEDAFNSMVEDSEANAPQSSDSQEGGNPFDDI